MKHLGWTTSFLNIIYGSYQDYVNLQIIRHCKSSQTLYN